MNLQFSRLEEARRNPKRFADQLKQAKAWHPNNRHFRAYFDFATRRFHKGESVEKVIGFFVERCADKLSNQVGFHGRLNQYKKALATYCESFEQMDRDFVESQKAVSLPLGPHLLSGKVERFDLRIAGGYSATITQMEKRDWEKELRWPLIQSALATECGCTVSEIEVGVYCFEDSSYSYRTFTVEEIADASLEATTLMEAIDSEMSSSNNDAEGLLD